MVVMGDFAFFASDGEESVCVEMDVDLGVEKGFERSGLESPVEPPQPPPCAPSPASSSAAGPGATNVIGQPGAPSVSDEPSSLVVHCASGSVTAAGQDNALVLADDFRLVAPTMVDGGARFAEWVRAMPIEDLSKYTLSFTAWKEAELQWIRSQRGVYTSKHSFSMRVGRTASKLCLRLAAGCKYDQWLRGEGSTSKAPLCDFLRSVHPELPLNAPTTSGYGWLRAGSNGFSGRKTRRA